MRLFVAAISTTSVVAFATLLFTLPSLAQAQLTCKEVFHSPTEKRVAAVQELRAELGLLGGRIESRSKAFDLIPMITRSLNRLTREAEAHQSEPISKSFEADRALVDNALAVLKNAPELVANDFKSSIGLLEAMTEKLASLTGATRASSIKFGETTFGRLLRRPNGALYDGDSVFIPWKVFGNVRKQLELLALVHDVKIEEIAVSKNLLGRWVMFKASGPAEKVKRFVDIWEADLNRLAQKYK